VKTDVNLMLLKVSIWFTVYTWAAVLAAHLKGSLVLKTVELTADMLHINDFYWRF